MATNLYLTKSDTPRLLVSAHSGNTNVSPDVGQNLKYLDLWRERVNTTMERVRARHHETRSSTQVIIMIMILNMRMMIVIMMRIMTTMMVVVMMMMRDVKRHVFNFVLTQKYLIIVKFSSMLYVMIF